MKTSDSGNNLPEFPLPERSSSPASNYGPLFRLWREIPVALRLGLILLGAGRLGDALLLESDRRFLASRSWIEPAVWSGLVVLFLVVTRRWWSAAFGPVLRYDLLRTARQGRAYVLRAVYGLSLLVVLFFVYSEQFDSSNPFGTLHLSIDDLARFADSFFTAFLAVQLGTVLLLTPVYAGTAIAEESEKKTLDDLLATHLLAGEIVLGKLLSRLLTMFLLLVGGLPVLSLLQLLGGVDPNRVLAGFVATLATVVSVGSLGVYNSVRLRQVRSAVIATYVQVSVYLVVSGLVGSCCLSAFGYGSYDFLKPDHWAGAGNPFVAYWVVSRESPEPDVFGVLRDYVLCQALWTLLFVGLATRRLRIRPERAERFRQLEPEGLGLLPQERRPRELPRVSDNPIFWKEYHAATWSWLPQWLVPWLILAGSLLVFCGMVSFLQIVARSALEGRFLDDSLTVWVVVFSLPLLCLGYLGVAVRSATCLGGERDRGTLDSLLTTPLENRTILGSKWWGSLLAVRVLWLALAGVWGLGLLFGGMHPLSLGMLLLAAGIYADFVARLGIWFSLRCRTTLRATVWTLVTLFALSVLPPLLIPGRFDASWFAELVRKGLSPPMTLFELTFGWNEEVWNPRLLFCFPVFGYAVAAQVLRLLTEDQFGPITGRMPHG